MSDDSSEEDAFAAAAEDAITLNAAIPAPPAAHGQRGQHLDDPLRRRGHFRRRVMLVSSRHVTDPTVRRPPGSRNALNAKVSIPNDATPTRFLQLSVERLRSRCRDRVQQATLNAATPEVFRGDDEDGRVRDVDGDDSPGSDADVPAGDGVGDDDDSPGSDADVPAGDGVGDDDDSPGSDADVPAGDGVGDGDDSPGSDADDQADDRLDDYVIIDDGASESSLSTPRALSPVPLDGDHPEQEGAISDLGEEERFLMDVDTQGLPLLHRSCTVHNVIISDWQRADAVTVSCPAGTFANGTSCQDCPPGFYQETEAQTSCLPCLNGTTTYYPRAVSAAECRGLNCPPDTVAYSNSCYILVGQPVDYMTARKICETGGGYPVIVKDEAEHQFLIDHLNSTVDIWIGLDDIIDEGAFMYNDGSPLGTFNKWAQALRPFDPSLRPFDPIAILGALTATVLNMFKTIAEVTARMARMALSPRSQCALAALSALSRRSRRSHGDLAKLTQRAVSPASLDSGELDRKPELVSTLVSGRMVQKHGVKKVIDWDEPTWSDNSGDITDIYRSHNPGSLFYWGAPQLVHYIARDDAGNMAFCNFTVIVKQHSCPYQAPPQNGAIACDTWLGGQFCSVSCNRDFDFAREPESLYYCKQEEGGGRWSLLFPFPFQDFIFPWPDCSRKTTPGAVADLQVQYYTTDCNVDTEEIRQNFIEQANMMNFLLDGFCMDEAECNIDNVQVSCGESAARGASGSTENIINVEFDVVVSWKEKSSFNESSVQLVTSLIDHLVMDIETTIVHGVSCPAGTFANGTSCQDCPPGFYQETEAQTSCLPCLNGTTTYYPRAVSAAECRDINCPPDTVAYSNSCYILVGQPVDYMTARRICETGGGYPVVVKDEAEHQFLIDHLNSTVDIWIGLDDIIDEGAFMYNDGSPLGAFNKWAQGITCSTLPSLDNGVATDGQFYGDVVTFSCNQGYELEGAVSLTCQLDKTWNGLMPRCIKITCQPDLPVPTNGGKTCSEGNRFQSTCSFSCQLGFRRFGPETRTCEHTGQWSNGTETWCEEITCLPLVEPAGGEVSPSTCTYQPVPAGTVCAASCVTGFTLIGHPTAVCSYEGDWFPSVLDVNCTAITCNQLHPPPKVLVEPETCTVSEASFLDNCTFFCTPGYAPKDGPGVMETTCSASSGQQKGEWTVSIADMDCQDSLDPVCESCPEDVSVYSADREKVIDWDEPTWSDNSGDITDIYRSHNPGSLFYWGAPQLVYYIARDDAGNMGFCNFTVIVKQHSCPYQAPPRNGAIACDTWLGGQFCSVSCNRDFDFAREPESLYYCKQEAEGGRWSLFFPSFHEFIFPWPDCSRRMTPAAVVGLQVQYYSSDCTVDTEEIRQNFVTQMRQLNIFVSGFCMDDADCNIDNVEVSCGSSTTTRSKRQANNAIRVDFNLVIIRKNDSVNASSDFVASQLQQLVLQIQAGIANGILNITSGNITLAPIPDSLTEITEVVLRCSHGQVLKNSSCLSCPVGTYANGTVCKDCPMGSYQEKEAQTFCLPCPNGTTTYSLRGTSITQCMEFCKPGTRFDRATATCRNVSETVDTVVTTPQTCDEEKNCSCSLTCLHQGPAASTDLSSEQLAILIAGAVICVLIVAVVVVMVLKCKNKRFAFNLKKYTIEPAETAKGTEVAA
ncbi:SVEP1 [Branchiostoma lanceolatum]|uniref:SVEP1 protein n=1 Tax=Branchiostoma lanceolatum TaxID=7740 RepID=A0A8S4MN12_BRALA|nr:SVEP1 [Branchiostoma lanceolatum]